MEDSILTSRTSVKGDSKMRPPVQQAHHDYSQVLVHIQLPGAFPLEVRNAANLVATDEPKLCPWKMMQLAHVFAQLLKRKKINHLGSIPNPRFSLSGEEVRKSKTEYASS
eukprot:767530-Hanusia_phi.AAC.1